MVKGKGNITATVVADSIAGSARLTTLVLSYPRFIHSEFMTHRMFSRNASSSRAIPVTKMNASTMENMAMPIHWGANQSGMQAREEHTAIVKPEWCGSMNVDMAWQNAGAAAVDWSQAISDAGYHKQICNRITEPYQFIKVVVTATEWDNFFALRLHPDAQPEIQELASVMQQAMEESRVTVCLRESDYWHLPFVDISQEHFASRHDAIKASVARCARVSYMNHDGTQPDIAKDIALHDRLLEYKHLSPFEHVARPLPCYMGSRPEHWPDGVTHMDSKYVYWSANFRGWAQYRQLL